VEVFDPASTMPNETCQKFIKKVGTKSVIAYLTVFYTTCLDDVIKGNPEEFVTAHTGEHANRTTATIIVCTTTLGSRDTSRKYEV
jgi:hypothetical protein